MSDLLYFEVLERASVFCSVEWQDAFSKACGDRSEEAIVVWVDTHKPYQDLRIIRKNGSFICSGELFGHPLVDSYPIRARPLALNSAMEKVFEETDLKSILLPNIVTGIDFSTVGPSLVGKISTIFVVDLNASAPAQSRKSRYKQNARIKFFRDCGWGYFNEAVIQLSDLDWLISFFIGQKKSRFSDSFLFFENKNFNFREFCAELLKNDILTIDGIGCVRKKEVVALNIGYKYKGVIYYIFVAFDEQFNKYSPGKCLLQLMVALRRFDGFDMLDFGFGDELYKQEFATHYYTVANIRYFKSKFFMILFKFVFAVRNKISKNRVFRLIRKGILTRAIH